MSGQEVVNRLSWQSLTRSTLESDEFSDIPKENNKKDKIEDSQDVTHAHRADPGRLQYSARDHKVEN